MLVSIQKGYAEITFYKNSICLGLCHSIYMKKISHLTPFVTIGGEGQITLDSRANFPLDSYRNL